jgi:hypothetical protein
VEGAVPDPNARFLVLVRVPADLVPAVREPHAVAQD